MIKIDRENIDRKSKKKKKVWEQKRNLTKCYFEEIERKEKIISKQKTNTSNIETGNEN